MEAPRLTDGPASLPASIDEQLAALGLAGAEVVEARWAGGLRDFELRLTDGRQIVFRDCLQASFYRPLVAESTPVIGAWWTDEPSPVLLTLDPLIRFLYSHLVFEIGDGLLRVACRDVEALD